MKKETSEALEKTIVRGELNLAKANAGTLRLEDISNDSCSLCIRFPECEPEEGEKCPVALRTGNPGCEGSPWWSVYDALSEALNTEGFIEQYRLVKAVEADINFLKSLRDS